MTISQGDIPEIDLIGQWVCQILRLLIQAAKLPSRMNV